MSHEKLVSAVEVLTKAVLDLTEAVKESILISKEELALVTSEEFTENLSRVVDEALDEAKLGREMLGK